MKKYILVLLFSVSVIHSQTFQVEKLNGNVKMLSSNSNTWQQVKSKMILNENDVVSTDINSSVLIKGNDLSFTLKNHQQLLWQI